MRVYRTETNHWNRTRPLAVAFLVGICFAGSAAAQTKHAGKPADDARWYPWVGCWQPSGQGVSNDQVTCVRPSAGSSADILIIGSKGVESREHLQVDGLPHPIDKDGCSGSETATWSASGNRIYVGSAYTCQGGLRGRSTRMFAILPSGVWLEVRDVHAGGGWAETVTRYHDAGLPGFVPADVRSEISHRELAVATARAAASAPVSQTDIAEASQAVDTVVVQSWLAARGQAFATDASAAQSVVPNGVRVYEGAPAAPPAPSSTSGYDMAAPCDPFGCYESNGYSEYNGYSYVPYAPGFGFGPGYFVPFASPLIVIRGTGRGVVHGRPLVGRPFGGRPPIVHTPGGHEPVGVHPGGHSPRGGMPGRGRP
jgi:hypothetical protein